MDNLSHWLPQVTLHKKNLEAIWFSWKWSCLKLVITLGVSLVLTHAGAVFLKMIRLRLHFSNIDKEVVVATKSVRAHDILPAWLCATFGSCALLAAYI